MSVRQRTLINVNVDRVEITIVHQTTYRYPGEIHESYRVVSLPARSNGNTARNTNRIFARIAFGCDYCDVRPVRGVYTGASVPSMSVIVAMEALTGTKQQR
jgi:transglutaminase-like putative cysteine protease